MLQREIDLEAAADIAKFEEQLERYLAGDLPEDVFRVFRLNNGIYGQRQGGHNQMVRVKAPYGVVTAEQLDMFAYISETYSRGWGHITTRQNIQFHFVAARAHPRRSCGDMASVGLTSREACGDTVRNVMGCHLAGACPFEAFDISPWAQATFDHFLRHPFAQRLPRKFKINFSGCETDCGQAMFNDVGVIASTRTLDDGTVEQGFRVFIAGGLGANPHPALALEDFTTKEDLLPTIESVLRVFEQTGNRDNKLRARLKWVVDQLGFDEVQRRVLNTRKFLRRLVELARRHPRARRRSSATPRPASPPASPPPPMGQGTPVSHQRHQALRPLGRGQRRARRRQGHRLGLRLGPPRRHHHRPVPGPRLDRPRARTSRSASPTARTWCSAASPRRQLPTLYARLEALGMAEPGAELARDVVACPGADTCNLAVTQSRGLADAIGTALEEAGLADVGGVRTNISGCTNSCGQHHAVDIGFFGAERRAHGQSAPGYQMLLGGYVGQSQMHFGEKALRLPGQERPRGRGAGRRPVRRASARPARASAAGWSATAAPRASPPT